MGLEIFYTDTPISFPRYFTLTHILYHILATSDFSVSRSSDIGRNGLVRDPVRVQGR